jgi:hypothetical protein
VLCKALGFNLSMLVHAMHELGVEPTFPAPRRIEPMRGPDAVPAPSELHAGRQTGIVGILALALEVRQAAGADGIAPVTIELGAGPRRGSASSAYERIT